MAAAMIELRQRACGGVCLLDIKAQRMKHSSFRGRSRRLSFMMDKTFQWLVGCHHGDAFLCAAMAAAMLELQQRACGGVCLLLDKAMIKANA